MSELDDLKDDLAFARIEVREAEIALRAAQQRLEVSRAQVVVIEREIERVEMEKAK